MSNETHPEGPATPPPMQIKVTMNANSKGGSGTDLVECRLQEYDLLERQISAGKYDPDGPADVSPVKST